MSSTKAAIRYSKAILDIATSKNKAKEVSQDMELISNTIKNSNELNAFIQSPTIATEVKQNALLEVFASTENVTKNLFKLLFENKRFELLNSIAIGYNQLFDESNNIETAYVTTAIPMTSEIEAKVLAKINSISNKKITIENIINPAILGGFILKIGDKQYNASIANRLKVLKRELSN